jgi:phage shock protein C
MICSSCRREIVDYSNFCYYCGARQAPVAVSKRLMRSSVDKKIAGVCGGFAEYLEVDPTIVRIVWIFVTIATGFLPGIIVYLAAWLLMPEAPRVVVPAPAPAPGPEKPASGTP